MSASTIDRTPVSEAKAKVLVKYPHAVARCYSNGWQVETFPHVVMWATPGLGIGQSEDEAWLASASLIEGPPMSYYCKRNSTNLLARSCFQQCGECVAWEALHAKEEYEAKEHSRKPVGCNETGQTEPKGLDCAASQISVSGKTTGEECPEQSGKCAVPVTKTAPLPASSPTSLRIKNERHDTWLLFEERNDDKTLLTMGHEMDGQHCIGVSMWLTDDELNKIVEWILPKSQRWP